MKVCISKNKKSKPKPKKLLKLRLGVIFLTVGTLVMLIAADGYVRAIIRGYPMAVATGVMQNLMDSAMEKILSSDDMPDLSNIDNVVYGNENTVVSIHTDTQALNKVKTAFVSTLKEILNEFGEYIDIRVPIGTLIGNEYTVGRGPRIRFKLQFSTTFTTSLESEFVEAGINNTQHTIFMNVNCALFLIIPWGNVTQSVSTNYILSQTVIAGEIPDAYTSVFDATGDITDDLFNYGAEVN